MKNPDKFLARLRTKNATALNLKNLIAYTKCFDTSRLVLRFTTHFLERAVDDRNWKKITLDEITASFDKLKTHYDFLMRCEPDERFVMRTEEKLAIVVVVTFDETNVRLRAVSCMRKKRYYSELKQINVDTNEIFFQKFEKPRKEKKTIDSEDPADYDSTYQTSTTGDTT